MNLRTGIFGIGGIGVAVLALGGTAIQEAVKGAATTAGARGMDSWFRASTSSAPSPGCRQPQPPPQAFGSTPDQQQRSMGPVADVPQPPPAVDVAALARWLAGGEFARAVQASRASPSLLRYASASDALERFGRMRTDGRPSRAQEALDLADAFAPPELRSVVAYWRCRYHSEIRRLDDLPCLDHLRESLDPEEEPSPAGFSPVGRAPRSTPLLLDSSRSSGLERRNSP